MSVRPHSIRVPTTGAKEIATFQSRVASLRSESKSLAQDFSAFLNAQGLMRDAGVVLLEGSEACTGFSRMIDKYIGRGFTEQEAETVPEPAANAVVDLREISRTLLDQPKKLDFVNPMFEGIIAMVLLQLSQASLIDLADLQTYLRSISATEK